MTTVTCYSYNCLCSYNILIGGDLTAKLADYGLAVPLVHVGSTQVMTVTTSIIGGHGYTGPELVDGKVGPHLDVYSYGVVRI